MKALLNILAAVSAVALLCSCGNQIQSAGTAEESGTAAVTPTSPETASSASGTETAVEPAVPEDKMNVDSLLSHGNTQRFQKALEKAQNGEEITVAYIGGSITEGYTVKPEECWAYLTHKWLCEKYPDAKINYVNAGLSGTPSTLGLIRCERDVVEPYGEPDIVFVEFAVNDAGDAVSKEGYESLVRKLLTLGSEPAVALIFMRTDTGYSCQNWQKEVGYLYHLPMISLNDALTNAINSGSMTWADYSNDGAHPNPEGCRIIAGMVEYMLQKAVDDISLSYEEIPPIADINAVTPIYGSDFVNMHLTDAASLTPVSMGEWSVTRPLVSFPNAWTRKGGDNNGITFDMEFDDLFIVYHCNKNNHYGTAVVYVDGEMKAEVNSYADDGWSNPVPKLIMRGDEKTRHSVEVKMKGDGEKDYYGILAFGITD